MEKSPTSSSSDMEKHRDIVSSDISRNELSPVPVANPKLEKRVWMKVDLWLLPFVTMFYFLSFLVRPSTSWLWGSMANV